MPSSSASSVSLLYCSRLAISARLNLVSSLVTIPLFKITGRPRRSVPHPTASRAAVNHFRFRSAFSCGARSKFRGRQELSRRIWLSRRSFPGFHLSCVPFMHHSGQFALPAARGDRFLIRRRHGRRQNLHSQLTACLPAWPCSRDVLPAGLRRGRLSGTVPATATPAPAPAAPARGSILESASRAHAGRPHRPQLSP